jgi:thiol:disulfide interchange protein
MSKKTDIILKKIMGILILALIKALMRAIVGLFIGASFIGLILMMLFIFGMLVPANAQAQIMLVEVVGLLLIGAIVGFFDLLDFGSKVSSQRCKENRGSTRR